jgi:hypothetical protein
MAAEENYIRTPKRKNKGLKNPGSGAYMIRRRGRSMRVMVF